MSRILHMRAKAHWAVCPKCRRVDYRYAAEMELCPYGRHHKRMLETAARDRHLAEIQRLGPQRELGLQPGKDPAVERRRANKYAPWIEIIYFDGTPFLQALGEVKPSYDAEATWPREV